MTIAETETFMVPLNKLTISEKNVRKTNAADIDDLLASIPVHGLIQNLNVEQTEKPGHFAVVAGGRRMRALKRLAKEKVITKDYPVKCSLVKSDAEALSLAENVIRAPMHPADQFDAFKQQIDAGKTHRGNRRRLWRLGYGRQEAHEAGSGGTRDHEGIPQG